MMKHQQPYKKVDANTLTDSLRVPIDATFKGKPFFDKLFLFRLIHENKHEDSKRLS